MRRIHWLASWLPFWLVLLVGIAEAQTAGDTRLQIRLRYSDGTAVIGETVILQRLPEEEPLPPALRRSQGDNCMTDVNGECTWYVKRGLYQVLFERPLDDISALAVAEGGLRGLGLTVGNEEIGDGTIAYHFTFHSDGRVYFDASPEAAVPFPIIPEGDVLQGGTAPTPSLAVTRDEPVEETATPEPTNIPDTAVDPVSDNLWHIVLFVAGGLVIGGGLHVWTRRRRQSTGLSDNKTTRLLDQETKNA